MTKRPAFGAALAIASRSSAHETPQKDSIILYMVQEPKQHGFSLVELLIAMAVSLIAVVACVSLMSKFARAAGAYAEASILEEARGSSENLLRSDLDAAGFNLARPSAPGAGKEFVQFINNPDYSTGTAGALTKLNDNASWAYASRAITSGVGLWQWTPTNICIHCWTYVVGGDNSLFALAVYYDQAGTSAIVIYESATASTVASNFGTGVAIPSHVPGDTYQIGLEAPNASNRTRFIRYYRIRGGIRTILYTSTAPLPTYPLYLLAYQASAASGLTNASFIGAPIINLLVQNQTDFAPLPFDGGTQLISPVTIAPAGNSVTILKGDKTTDAMSLRSTFSSGTSQLDVRTPARGSLAVNDVVLVVDYGSADPLNPVTPASSVCVVTAVSAVDSQTTRLTVTRARQSNPAWTRLWSSDTDHAHTFAADSAIVIKLSAPVTYSLSTDARLVRIEGARVSTIAFNARQFLVIQNTTSPVSFSVTAALAAEGFETDNANETRSSIAFTSTPRAMALASNQLN
jgi:prepilin-type N-terminal cleavage/methylation domain-containing protein